MFTVGDPVRVPSRPEPVRESPPPGLQQPQQQFQQQQTQPQQGPRESGENTRKKWVVLDEKYFRRVEMFDGDFGKYRSWLFDVLVAIGGLHKCLAEMLKHMLEMKNLGEDWTPPNDSLTVGLWEFWKVDLYEDFAAELFGLLVSLTAREAKGIVKEVYEKGQGHDGFKALMSLNRRYDSKTSASLLSAFMEVVSPGQIKHVKDVISAVRKWESKTASLKMRYGDRGGELNPELKKAILVGMLPNEFRDWIMQQMCKDESYSYDTIRDQVVGVANQKIQMANPTPMDIGQMGGGGGDEPDLDAVNKANVKCYNCGGFGHYHYSRECTEQKGGKGVSKGQQGPGKGQQQWSPNYHDKGYQPKGIGGKGDPKGGKGGKPWNQTGGGKGYQGVCYNCKKVGHKAWECRSARVQGVEEGDEQADQDRDASSVEIGRVWNIGCVEECEDSKESCDGWCGVGPIRSRRHLLQLTKRSTRYASYNKFNESMAEGELQKVDPETPKVLDDSVRSEPDTKEERTDRSRGGRWRKKKKNAEVFVFAQEDVCIAPVGVDSKETQMCLGFQVADVKKPLISVKRIVEKGNHVSFGPQEGDNFILNKATGDKMMLKTNGKGSYLMDVCFVGGGRTEITVDSGAEENVCPWHWGEQFPTRPADRWMRFKNASGGEIGHFGKRDVLVVSPF